MIEKHYNGELEKITHVPLAASARSAKGSTLWLAGWREVGTDRTSVAPPPLKQFLRDHDELREDHRWRRLVVLRVYLLQQQ